MVNCKRIFGLVIGYLELVVIISVLVERIMGLLGATKQKPPSELPNWVHWGYLLFLLAPMALVICLIHGIYRSREQYVLAWLIVHLYALFFVICSLVSTYIRTYDIDLFKVFACGLWLLCLFFMFLVFRDIKHENGGVPTGNSKRTFGLVVGYSSIVICMWISPVSILQLLGHWNRTAEQPFQLPIWLNWVHISLMLSEITFSICLLYGIYKSHAQWVLAYIIWFTVCSVLWICQTVWWTVDSGCLNVNNAYSCISLPFIIYVIFALYREIEAENAVNAQLRAIPQNSV